LFDDIFHKANFINDAIRKKYRKAYEMPDWDEDEIAEMDGHMRSYMRGCMVKKEMIRSRITWQCNPTALLIMKYINSQHNDDEKLSHDELELVLQDKTFKRAVY